MHAIYVMHNYWAKKRAKVIFDICWICVGIWNLVCCYIMNWSVPINYVWNIVLSLQLQNNLPGEFWSLCMTNKFNKINVDISINIYARKHRQWQTLIVVLTFYIVCAVMNDSKKCDYSSVTTWEGFRMKRSERASVITQTPPYECIPTHCTIGFNAATCFGCKLQPSSGS
jgi:hypothetical protein